MQRHGGGRRTGARGETGRGEIGARGECSGSAEAPMGSLIEQGLQFCSRPLLFPVTQSLRIVKSLAHPTLDLSQPYLKHLKTSLIHAERGGLGVRSHGFWSKHCNLLAV